MTRIHAIYTLIAVAAVAVCGGCDRNIVWTRTVGIPSAGWTAQHPVLFELDPKAYEPEENKYVLMTARAVGDTVPRLRGDFHAYLSLRYRDDCNIRALGVEVEKLGLDEALRNDTVIFTLFHDGGGAAGHGRFGLNETTVPLPYTFRVAEGTVITVTPLQYPEPLTGVMSLTLTLSKQPMTEKSRYKF
ncbi:MAG: hypothetical protein K2F87_05730 [Muribaculaceae bacterium]|nr:hypothetical protein [Muribaculaceae bacterium]